MIDWICVVEKKDVKKEKDGKEGRGGKEICMMLLIIVTLQ